MSADDGGELVGDELSELKWEIEDGDCSGFDTARQKVTREEMIAAIRIWEQSVIGLAALHAGYLAIDQTSDRHIATDIELQATEDGRAPVDGSATSSLDARS